MFAKIRSHYWLLATLSLVASSISLLRAEALDASSTISVNDLFEQAEQLSGQAVQVKGFVAEVCKHRGCKAFLRDSGAESKGTLRVQQTGNMPAFDADLGGQTLLVSGVVRTEKVDDAYLNAWEARVSASGTVCENSNGEEGESCSANGEEAAAAKQAVLKRIAHYRKLIQESEEGYLLSVWLDGESWAIQPGA